MPMSLPVFPHGKKAAVIELFGPESSLMGRQNGPGGRIAGAVVEATARERGLQSMLETLVLFAGLLIRLTPLSPTGHPLRSTHV